MQILIISLPSGEQVTSLNHTIDAEEALIGQSSSCQILLPDQQEQVAERHARIFREDDRWYLENLSDKPLQLNTTDVCSGSRRRCLLADGDMISCGDYRLMVSDFSPWQENLAVGLDTPILDGTAEHGSDFCIIHNKDETVAGKSLNDPFDDSVESEPASDPLVTDEFSMKNKGFSLQENNQQESPLIDVLAEETEEDDDDWSINRHLWTRADTEKRPTKQPDVASVPVLSDLVKPDLVRIEQTPERAHSGHQHSVCQAMLQSLEQFIDDISPEKLEKIFLDSTIASRHQNNKHKITDYWSQYQTYYQQLIKDKHYRLLFLHRFRQALKQQEQQQEQSQ